ncbi:hypothetical protein AWB66_01604 [Caballeronia telluris]|uniref:Secreted protein n=1 Tax=Caballeronia telluris TaxID=326475 RepID=A0A158G6V6_9BURK|nr:hypothetical protein AWB66_01604 [Caballeronia telluris]
MTIFVRRALWPPFVMPSSTLASAMPFVTSRAGDAPSASTGISSVSREVRNPWPAK